LEDEKEEGDSASDTSEFKLNSGRGLFTTKTDVDDSSFASTKEHYAGKALLSCRTAGGIPLLYCFMKTVAFSHRFRPKMFLGDKVLNLLFYVLEVGLEEKG
jgi:hypothetical protein